MAKHLPARNEGDPIGILTSYSVKQVSVNFWSQTQSRAEAILRKALSPRKTGMADCVRKIPIEFRNAPPFHPIIFRN